MSLTQHLIDSHQGRICVSLAEAADVLDIDYETARLMAVRGQFPAFKAARGRYKVMLALLAAWIEAGGVAQYEDRPAQPAKPAAKPARKERPSSSWRAVLAAA